MSKVSEQATVIVQIADFANIDQTGKGNILGVGGNIIPLGAAGMTPGFPYSRKSTSPLNCVLAKSPSNTPYATTATV